MPKIDDQAYIQTRIIFVDNCAECPYVQGNAIAPLCFGINRGRDRYEKGRELPNFFPRVPDWCPLEGADICG